MKNHEKIRLIEDALPSLRELLSPCRLCAHECGRKRLECEKGICGASKRASVYSYSPHHGEEPPLSGEKGSGTIFFTRCNLKCVYCQNYIFSQEGKMDRAQDYGSADAREVTADELAEKMIALQEKGCHNINLVSPTHYAAQIAEALSIALKDSLDIPIVYNTGGYDSPELIRLLDGIIDIYLVDMRYAENDNAAAFSSAPRYKEINRLIVKEMFRQVGVLKSDKNKIAKKGVIVRLLILPDDVSGTIETLRFLKEEVSSDIYLSIMSQYHPAHEAAGYPRIARRINEKEYASVVNEAEKLGFPNGWTQGFRADTERFFGTNITPGFGDGL